MLSPQRPGHHYRLHIPTSKRGKVIGNQGQRINAIKKQTFTKIDNTTWFKNKKEIHGFIIKGSQKAVIKAVDKINSIINPQWKSHKER
jgi:polyribonucleotide nucleotidyltransferase